MVVVLENVVSLTCHKYNEKVEIFAVTRDGTELPLGTFLDMKYAKSIVDEILMYYTNITEHPDKYSVYQIPYDIREINVIKE